MNSTDENMADTSHRALVIEDDPLILEILVFKFKERGWEVTSSVDGEKGLEKAKSDKSDLILLDILLPGVSGYEVLAQLKSDDTTIDIPVLVLSNYGQKEEIEKSLSLGAVDHLVKANVILDDVIENAAKIIEGHYVPVKKEEK